MSAKKKGNQIYYYVVENARVDGRPRIVHQSYLGSPQKVADLVRDRTAPVPLSATMRDFGLPGALWWAAQQTGVFDLLLQLWPQPRSGPSAAHYLILAAIPRICQPGPKTEVAAWYDRTLLPLRWGFSPERFTSQAFWDCFETWPRNSLWRKPATNWKRRNCACSVYGSRSRWSAAVCWATIPPTFIPI